MKWTFVFFKKGKTGGWWCKITSQEQLLRFVSEYDFMDKDYKHAKKLTQSQNESTRHAYISHSWFGGVSRWLTEDIDTGYAQLRKLWLDTAEKILNEKGVVYVNRRMGICVGGDTINFQHKTDLSFPKRAGIRIERFPDGKHFYAFIGETQVREGDKLKWDTYDEAVRTAEEQGGFLHG